MTGWVRIPRDAQDLDRVLSSIDDQLVESMVTGRTHRSPDGFDHLRGCAVWREQACTCGAVDTVPEPPVRVTLPHETTYGDLS